MTTSAEQAKHIKATFPQTIFEQLAADVLQGQRSAFIIAATEETLYQLGPGVKAFPEAWQKCAS